jgi:hypothetical protein
MATHVDTYRTVRVGDVVSVPTLGGEYTAPAVITDIIAGTWGANLVVTMTRSGKGKVVSYKLITTTREKTK